MASPDSAAPDEIQFDVLRTIAGEAVRRGETVRLLVGERDGQRVETLVLEPSLRAAQSSGSFVTSGIWSGERLVTDRGGHMLDVDGTCFCRDCETVGGFCVDDDE